MTKQTLRSYLLRLWRDHAQAPLRATLIAVELPDKPRHFATMDELFAFLLTQSYPVTLAEGPPNRDGDQCTPDDAC